MKKILALTMALVLVLSLGACGKAPAAETRLPPKLMSRHREGH